MRPSSIGDEVLLSVSVTSWSGKKRRYWNVEKIINKVQLQYKNCCSCKRINHKKPAKWIHYMASQHAQPSLAAVLGQPIIQVEHPRYSSESNRSLKCVFLLLEIHWPPMCFEQTRIPHLNSMQQWQGFLIAKCFRTSCNSISRIALWCFEIMSEPAKLTSCKVF